MGLTYKIDVEHGIVRTRGWGIISAQEIEEHMTRKLVDPRFDPAFRSLFVVSEVINLDISTISLAQLAATPIYDGGARHAILATRDVVYGIARMYASYIARFGQEVRVFRQRDMAEAWIAEGV